MKKIKYKQAALMNLKDHKALKISRDIEDYILWELAIHALNDGVLSHDESKAFMDDLSSFL